MRSQSESNYGATSNRRIDEMSSRGSNSLRNKAPISQIGKTPLLSQSLEELPSSCGVKRSIPSGKSIKKAFLKRFKSQNPSQSPKRAHHIKVFDEYGCSTQLPNGNYSVVVHPTSVLSDTNSSKPAPSGSPRNEKIAASTSSTKAASPKLTLIDLFAVEKGINIDIPQRTNILPPSKTPSSRSSSNSPRSQASTTPIETVEKTLGEQSTQEATSPTAKNETLQLKKQDLYKRQLPKSVTLDETSLMTKTTRNASEECDSPGTPTTSPNFSPNSSLEEYDGNNGSSESGTSTIPLLAAKKLRIRTKGELKNSYLDASINQKNINSGKSPENGLELQKLQTENQNQALFQGTRTRKGTAKKIRKKKVVRTYYYKTVARTLSRIRPKTQITLPSLQIMDNFVKDMFDRLATEAGRLMRISGRKTMTARDMHFATRLVLPGKLGEKAMWAGRKALEKYAKEATPLKRDIEKPGNEIENQQKQSS